MKTYWMIWAAFVIAVFHYPVIALFVFPTPAEGGGEILFTYIFGFVGLVCGMGSLFVWSRMIVEPFREGKLKVDLESNPPKLNPLFIIAWALAEAPAVYGIVAAVLEPVQYATIGFSAFSLLILLLESPAILNEKA